MKPGDILQFRSSVFSQFHHLNGAFLLIVRTWKQECEVNVDFISGGETFTGWPLESLENITEAIGGSR